jgi:hypothetical protein
MLALFHLAPHVVGTHAGGGPQHGEIIQKVGALADDGFGLAVDGVDDDLDGLLRQLLRHLVGTALKQPGGSRNRRIEILGRDDCVIKPFERITHALKIIQTPRQRVNDGGLKPENHGPQ